MRNRSWRTLIGGAVLYSLLFAMLSQTDKTGVCVPAEIGRRFLLAFPAAFILLLFLFRIPGHFPRLKLPCFSPLPAFFLIFLAFVPLFIVYYPASVRYDVAYQIRLAGMGKYSAQQPLLYTLLIRGFLSLRPLLGTDGRCMALYSLFQMACMSGCFTLACASAERVRGGWGTVSAVCYALHPLHMAFASNAAKDVLFSGFLLVFFSLSLEYSRFGKLPGRRWLLLILVGILSALLRANLRYALLAWLALLLLRRRLRPLLYAGLAVLLLSAGIDSALQAGLHAKPAPVREMLSVPLQQLARAASEEPDAFSAEERERLRTLFRADPAEMYAPSISDPVKDYLREEVLKENFGEYAALWVTVGRRCPGVYLDAFLNLALPSLYPYSEYTVEARYLEMGMGQGFVDAAGDDGSLGNLPRFARLREALDYHVFRTGADDIPVIRFLFNTGLVFWMVLLAFLYSLYRGELDRAGVSLLLLLLWGTYLFGPVMQARYAYPFLCALPVMFAVPRPPEKKNNANEQA